MPMMYQSTRDQENKVTASQAILQGLAADGGLFTPVSFPKLALSFNKLKDESYQAIAKLVLSAFLMILLKMKLSTVSAQLMVINLTPLLLHQ